MVLGHPRQKPAFQKGRLSAEFVTHFGQYHDYSDEQLKRIVAEYDDDSKHIGLIEDWEAKGFKHYLDWYYTKWAAKPPEEKIAAGKVLEFQERLMKCGFWWPMP